MAAYNHPNDGPSPICPGASTTQTNNPTWFAFTAWCTDLRLRVTSTNCHQAQFGYIGFQLAIYTDCTFTDLVACNADVFDCNTDDKILNLSGLNIGSIYYFMVDGCLGSYCTVTIDIIGTCGSEQIDPWTFPLVGETDPCVGETETYWVEDLNGARIYHWYVDGVLQGQTATENFDVQWTTPGTYQLCVDASNDPCVEVSDPPEPLCTTVIVHGSDAGELIVPPSPLCTGEAAHISSFGFSPGIENLQMIIITDVNGTIIFVAEASSVNFISDTSGVFTVYAYNFNYFSGATYPVYGSNISDIDCSSACCDLISQVIIYQSIDVVASNIQCDDNGTGNDLTDDLFYFNILVNGLTPGGAWLSTDGNVIGTYGTPVLCGPYLISNGTVNLDIHDVDKLSCLALISVDPPASCSSCPDSMNAGTGSLLNCINTTAVLTGTSSAEGIYHWSGPGSFESDSLRTVVVDSGWYLLSVDFGKQCISVDSVYVAQDLSTAVANAGADQQLDCLHSAVTLDASGSSGNNFTLQWITSDGLILSTQSFIVVDSAGLYVLQLTNTQTGCTSKDTATVTINQNELGIISFLVMDENCEGNEDGVIEVMDIPGGMPPYNFTLNGTANTTGAFNQLAPGDYQLHISDAAGCSLDTTITIHEGVDLEVEVPEIIILTENEGGSIEAQVNVSGQSLSSIQWTPAGVLSCDTCLSTNVFTNTPQTLTITVMHVNGCVASAEVDILIVPSPDIYVPNTFSPNDDGINDRFTIFTNEGVLSILEINIFDRWGDQLFGAKEILTNELNSGWDGTFHQQKVPAGVYVYTAKVLLADGEEKNLKGDITLVR